MPRRDVSTLGMDENLLPKVESVALINVLGQRTFLTKSASSLTFDISPFEAGIYFVEFQIKGKNYTKKIMIR